MLIILFYNQQGTNVEDAKRMIKESRLRIQAKDSLDEAADLAVKLSHIVRLARTVDLDVSFEFHKYH